MKVYKNMIIELIVCVYLIDLQHDLITLNREDLHLSSITCCNFSLVIEHTFLSFEFTFVYFSYYYFFGLSISLTLFSLKGDFSEIINLIV